MYKVKFHHLAHSAQFIERFGPMGLYAEDRLEKFHGAWRNSSVFSNHHSASSDSAAHFNSLDTTKHLLSGGYFMWDGRITQAGSKVIGLFKDQHTIQERLELRYKRSQVPGIVEQSIIGICTLDKSNVASNRHSDCQR